MISNNINIIYPLNSKFVPEISEVGGKGYSLIRLSSLNLIVPNGIVLTVAFLQDWIKEIAKSSLYKSFIDLLNKDKISNEKECLEILNKLKDWCLDNLKLEENKKIK